jgi:hypothetical protein
MQNVVVGHETAVGIPLWEDPLESMSAVFAQDDPRNVKLYPSLSIATQNVELAQETASMPTVGSIWFGADQDAELPAASAGEDTTSETAVSIPRTRSSPEATTRGTLPVRRIPSASCISVPPPLRVCLLLSAVLPDIGTPVLQLE